MAVPLRLCQGTKKKVQWLWGLVATFIIVSSIYLFHPKEGIGSGKYPVKSTANWNNSLRHLSQETNPSSTKALNDTSLKRETDKLLAKLLRPIDGRATLPDGGCHPRSSVFMVKTHKCSSSTLQNILLRRAEHHGLRVAVPAHGVYISEGERFNRTGIFGDDGVTTYNIMASHMRLHQSDYDEIKQVMKEDAVWITILRDPAKQFESLYTYYGWKSRFESDLHGFLQDPDLFYIGREQGSPRNVARNSMMYDNGLDSRHMEFGDSRVSEFISMMDEQFDLVLLADFFDESLILLKEMMCWSIDDVAYISQNARTQDSIDPVTESEKAAMRKWNWADYLMYDHFNRTLINRIKTFGIGRMSKELAQLHKRKQELAADCILKALDSGDERVWYPNGMKMSSCRANLDAEDPHLCEQLCRPELVYLEKMREIAVTRQVDGSGQRGGMKTSTKAAEKEPADFLPPVIKDTGRVFSKTVIVGGGIGDSEVTEADSDDGIGIDKREEETVVNSKKLSAGTAGRENKFETSEPAKSHGITGNLKDSGIAQGQEKNVSGLSGTSKQGGDGQGSCQPSDRVVMIKTHKCSSSTLQNILLRRAEDRRLAIALPKDGVYFHQLYDWRRQLVLGDDGRRKYDMMASHMKFDIKKFQGIKDIMKSGTKYITILRDPASQYESMYNYYKFQGRFKASLGIFLRNTEIFPAREDRRSFKAGRNPMCHDNGLNARFLEPGDPAVDRFIESLDQIHDLVLIAEYFDVSLILLKELMCWSMEDVVYFKQNARSTTSVMVVDEGDKQAIRKWNWADTLLYEHFNRTLWKKVAVYGEERMKRDVRVLQARNAELSEECIQKTLGHADPRVWYPGGVKVNSFVVNKNAKDLRLCEQLTRPELVYLRRLREIRSRT